MAKEDQAQSEESSQPGALVLFLFLHDVHVHMTVSKACLPCQVAERYLGLAYMLKQKIELAIQGLTMLMYLMSSQLCQHLTTGCSGQTRIALDAPSSS